MLRITIIACSFMLLSACAAPNDAYVQADRLTFDAIAPEYQNYLESDDKLGAKDRSLRFQTLASWELRLKAAEASYE